MFGAHHWLTLTLTHTLAVCSYIGVCSLLFYRAECVQGTWWRCVLVYVVAFIPPLATLIMLPKVIRIFVIVSNIELMKKHPVMTEVVRSRRTNKALRALRMVCCRCWWCVCVCEFATGLTDHCMCVVMWSR